LLHPQPPQAKALVEEFRNQYKMDPEFVKKVDDEWGPLDWRLPEASAIYWAARGLEMAKEHPEKVNQSDLIKLRRVIYQSLLQAFYHGRLVTNPFDKSYEYYPDLDLVSRVNDAYVTSYAEETDPAQKNSIKRAHGNFLSEAVYFLYVDDRIGEAAKWFRYLSREYPDKPLIDDNPHTLPSDMTLDQYAIACVQGDVNRPDQDRTRLAVEGLLRNAYYELAIGHDDRYAGYKLLAAKIYEAYEKYISYPGGQERLPIPAFADINRTVLNQLLSPKGGLPFAARAVLRTQLQLPPETVSTNAPPASVVSTNATEAVSTNVSNSVSK